ncbi:MAG: serine hydrolase, partial [Firmicutes bacterium]|nr:serine hydrolase [Bacillota bacterium]
MSRGWTAVRALLADAVARAEIPGAVAAVGRGHERWWAEAVGWAELGENPRAMHLDTLFDLASLTKVVATLPVILDLAAEGRLT